MRCDIELYCNCNLVIQLIFNYCIDISGYFRCYSRYFRCWELLMVRKVTSCDKYLMVQALQSFPLLHYIPSGVTVTATV
jgi:hypothetical protein